MKHTPGPWTFDKYGNVITPSGDTLLVNGVSLPSGNHPQLKEAQANSRLIAAAPELLEALKVMRDAFWGTSHNEAEDAANELARAAIAKAEGA